jgi:homoprotocatechuate degradation regulator HpaR
LAQRDRKAFLFAGGSYLPLSATVASAPQPSSEALRTHRRHLALELLATRERFMLYFRPTLTSHNITEQQWRIVRALAATGEMTAGEMAQRCVILKPSLTGILARMEELGWVTRLGDAADQRRSVVRLTAPGNALHKKINREVEVAHAAIVSALGADELEALHTALDRFNAALDRLA